MKNVKVGLICVTLEGEHLELAEKFHEAAKKSLSDKGINIVNPNSGYTLSGEEVLDQLKQCENSGAGSIIFLIGTWLLASHIVDAAQAIKLPIGIWGIPESVSFSSVGLNVVHGALEEIGFKHEIFYGMPNNKQVVDNIAAFTSAAEIVKKCRKARFGLLGGRAISAYPTSADPNQIKAIFGIEVEQIDQLLLLEKAKAVSEEKTEKFIDTVKSRYGAVSAGEEYLRKSAGVYVALKEIIEEYSLDFCSVKCLGEFIDTYTSCCLPISMLDDEGYIVGCQCNINASISAFILSNLSDGPVFSGDINMVNIEDKTARLINCGYVPGKLAESYENIELVEQYEYMGKGRGVCPFFCMKPGDITFGTLGRRAGKYVMNIAVGEAYNVPMEELKKVRNWAQGFVKLKGNSEKFYERLLCNHSVMGYGDHKKELEYFCTITGVKIEED